MIDATFVEIPRQRNNREDNALIKAGEADAAPERLGRALDPEAQREPCGL